jgi:hypothetical protein
VPFVCINGQKQQQQHAFLGEEGFGLARRGAVSWVAMDIIGDFGLTVGDTAGISNTSSWAGTTVDGIAG